MNPEFDVQEELLHLRDEVIALQIKVAALESLLLNEKQHEEYSRILKEQTDRMMTLRLREMEPPTRQ